MHIEGRASRGIHRRCLSCPCLKWEEISRGAKKKSQAFLLKAARTITSGFRQQEKKGCNEKKVMKLSSSFLLIEKKRGVQKKLRK